MEKRVFIKSILANFGFGLVFHIVVPVCVLFVINIFFSTMTVLDPLYAGKHFEDIWTGFAEIFIFLAIYSILVGLSLSLWSVWLAEKIRSGWIYPAAAGSGYIVHFLLLAILGGGFYMASKSGFFLNFAVLYAFFMMVIAPLAGMICLPLIRKKQKFVNVQRPEILMT